jgi:predicted dienelactone hydrolase
MHIRSGVTAGLLFILLLAPIAGTAGEVEKGQFHDRDRDRKVPFTAYWPNLESVPTPVVIFSHGLGGTRETASYFGRALAGAGYVSIHIQHHGSDGDLVSHVQSRADRRQILRASLRNFQNFADRLDDIPFVIDELGRRNNVGQWAGRFDLSRIGMAGHSYGARSTMYAAGEFVGLIGGSAREPRIKAAVVLSPNLPKRDIEPDRHYGGIRIPLFHVTGTLDDDPAMGPGSASRRTLPFKLIPHSPQYLLVLDGADHATFSGTRLGTDTEKPGDKAHTTTVSRAAVAFFDAHLRGLSSKENWIESKFSHSLASGDHFEFK